MKESFIDNIILTMFYKSRETVSSAVFNISHIANVSDSLWDIKVNMDSEICNVY